MEAKNGTNFGLITHSKNSQKYREQNQFKVLVMIINKLKLSRFG